jgi:hypothetical protein
MKKQISKNIEIFKNIKKIDDIKTISSINLDNKSQKESPIKIISQNNKLTLSSLFIDNNSNNTFIISIIKYLSYSDLLQFQKISKKYYSILSNPKIRKEYILHSNISDNEHLLFYESNINIKQLKDILIKELTDYNITSNIYKNILSLSNESKQKNQKYSHVIEEIQRDINRTFYTDKFKKGNGKEMLINILSALAFIRPEIGYCQGMNFIAGALIELIDEEEKIFWIFLSFIDNIDLNLLFLTNMPDYSIRVFQLNYYIKHYYPQLFIHFKKHQINPDIFFSKWILTIFSNYLPFHKLYKIWDLFIIDKWKAIFRISMVLLGLMKDKLIKLDLNEFCLFFKSKEIKEMISFKYICEHYRDFKITNKQLIELKKDFFVEKVKEKLNDKIQEWDIDQKEFVTIYEKELKNHENEIKEKIDNLKNKIEKYNKKCEIKNQKYIKQLDIVNNYKLQLETKIEVKSGYEKVYKRNNKGDYNFSLDNNKNKKNNNNINIGININVNHNIDNIQKEQKDKNQINIINNHNNIYVNNINIINPNQFDFNDRYQINNLNNNNIAINKKFTNLTKSSSTYRNKKDKNNDDINKRRFSFKKFGNFSLFSRKPSDELEKIKIKINNLDKEIDSINNGIIKNYKILDKYKLSLEKSTNKKDAYKKKLDDLINQSQKYKDELLKNLSEKLKLSVKFVSTNNY